MHICIPHLHSPTMGLPRRLKNKGRASRHKEISSIHIPPPQLNSHRIQNHCSMGGISSPCLFQEKSKRIPCFHRMPNMRNKRPAIKRCSLCRNTCPTFRIEKEYHQNGIRTMRQHAQIDSKLTREEGERLLLLP